MKTAKKVAIVLIILFIVRNISNCRCPDNVIFFDFRVMEISDIYSTNSDTISNSSVAFNVTLLPEDNLLSLQNKKNSDFGFSMAHATSCDQEYQVISRIEEINITTLFKISDNQDKNSDVTDLFLTDNTSSSSTSHLYTTIDEIYDKINQTNYWGYRPSQSFSLFLKPVILNDSAQFIIDVKFSDDFVLSDTTRLFYIRQKNSN